MKSILLYGEGPKDYGKQEYGTGIWIDGPVQSLMRMICRDIEIESIGSLKDGRPKIQKSLKGLKGHGMEALILSLIAKEKGKDIAALYIDADRTPGSRPTKETECKKRYRELKEDADKGFQQSKCELPYITIVPMKMIESWLMSDTQSFINAFGGKGPQEQARQPELEWGEKRDPESNYPKNKLERMLRECGQNPNRETFVALVENCDIEVLRQKCPISFEDFYMRFLSLTKNG